MKNSIIRTEQEYQQACDKLYSLINSYDQAVEPDSLRGKEMQLLALLIEAYEKDNYKMLPPDPVEAIKFRMEQMQLKQSEIAPLFGGKTRASEVLNRKRRLTLKMITLLNRYLGIPLESLIAGNQEISLDPRAKEKLLQNPAIRNTFALEAGGEG